MFQKLPIANAQIKASNTFEILNQLFKQIISSLYQTKEITLEYIKI